MKSHREMYPEQYTHPAVGRRARAPRRPELEPWIITRVVSTRYGELTPISPDEWLALKDLQLEDD